MILSGIGAGFVHFGRTGKAWAGLLLLLGAAIAGGQPEAANSPVTISVADENGAAVAGARVTIVEPGTEPAQLWTDYAGNCRYTLRQREPYEIAVEKAGFYKADESGIDPNQSSVKVALEHEQIVREQVNVTASAPGIDIQQVGDQSTMNTPEIVNIPYPTSHDIRNLLPFNPGVVPDATGQCTWPDRRRGRRWTRWMDSISARRWAGR
jgi:hypothetical protein